MVTQRQAGAATALAVLWTSYACGAEPVEEVGALVRDSAGVEIVLNYTSLWADGSGWRLSDEPVLSTAREGDERYEFSMIHDATRLDGGRIAVAAGGAREIRVYDHQGEFLARLGRRGMGPGEFTSLTGIWHLPGDSLLVYDRGQLRLSVFAPTGKFARLFHFDVLGGRAGSPRLVGPMGGGRLLALQEVYGHPPETRGVQADSAYVLSLDMEGSRLGTLAFVPEEVIYVNSTRGRLWTSRAPFAPKSYWAVAGDGFVFGSGHSSEIGVYRADGSLRRLVRWSESNRRVTAEDIERYKEALPGLNPSPDILSWVRLVAEDMEFPATMAAHGPLKVDPDGNLWVSEFARPGRPVQTWLVFNAAGRLLGSVEMPVTLRVYEIGSDYVMGQWQDELNVQSVRQYRLIKSD